MREAIQSIFKSQRKGSGSTQKAKGFTLIELLVAVILAALVITPLLGFMINILATDRKEQAKAATEQELQAALDYIARDLEQAVYIYDGKGLRGTGTAGIGDSLVNMEGEPVLAFWKRKNLPRAVDRNFETTGRSCPTSLSKQQKERQCNDYFVYSLVVYSLIEGASVERWSNAARIARFEISDGIRDPTSSDPNARISANQADPKFQLFQLKRGQSIETSMNAWESAGGPITQGNALGYTNVLVDYIDQSKVPGNADLRPVSADYCLSPLGLDNGKLQERERDKPDPKTPQQLNTLPANSMTSFFACVDTERTLAHVYLRGNALARIQNKAEYDKDSPYFPNSTITVEGVGSIE
ncbi:hormogonium polysaccharide secretion pseudopilin HpsC [Coleofasciculus sp. G2-EDA-02]|uniref:hormogonium polysaccharide secretion pseudopilin HpsC n=1 Tax=Coleofasciculus sp. G2-EDA-02 TaxID=3069529 RepID=UPI0032FB0F8E